MLTGWRIADLNRDGIPDLAVLPGSSTSYAENLTILLGNGDGTFQISERTAPPLDSTFVTAGDFNGDGQVDLAVSSGIGAVSVLLGKGNGTFRAPLEHFSAGESPTQLAVADFNGDGKLDIIATNYAGGYDSGTGVTVLLGSGNGSFRSPLTYYNGVAPLPYAAALGDFNGDGKTDVVTANGSNTYALPGMSIVLGNGKGYFTSGSSITTGVDPTTIAVADFNHDGKLDVVLGDYMANTVIILFGNGDGTFQTPIAYPAGTIPNSIAVGDFNGDRAADIAVSNPGTGISVLLNDGRGNFGSPVSYATGSNCRSLAVADFNLDGKLDLAIVNYVTGLYDGLSVLLGNGDGTFQTPIFTAGPYGQSIVVVDFNGDGIPDVALSEGGSIGVWLGLGNGTFSPPTYYNSTFYQGSLVSADFNHDGYADLAVAAYQYNLYPNSLVVLYGNGDGTFGASDTYTLATANAMVAGNLNEDGFADLVITGVDGYLPGSVTVLLNTRNTSTSSQRTLVGVPSAAEKDIGTKVQGK